MDQELEQCKALLEQRTRELKASETRFHNIVTRGVDGILIVDQDGIVRLINLAAQVLLGHAADDLVGTRLDFPAVAGGTTERDIVRPDGEAITVEVRATAIEWEGKTACLISLRDITGRKRADKALAESQRRLQALFNNALDAILLADDAGHWIDANPAACALLGLTCDELVQLSVWDFTPPSIRERSAELWQTFIATGEQTREYRLFRKDGTAVEIEYRAVANIVPGVHLAVLHDITRRKRALEALEQRNGDLNLLNQVSQAITATLNLREVTERLMRTITETISAAGGSVWLRSKEPAGGLVCLAAAHRGLKRPLNNLRLSPGEGIAGWVALHGQSAIVPRVSDDPRFSPIVDEQIGFHTISVLAVPLRVRDKVIGVLEAVNKRNGDFDAHDCALIETLAPSAAIAIENARLVETLRQQTLELQARNQDLDAFAHSVAHDLKTPLSLIIGYAGLSQDLAEPSAQELRRNLQMIVQNGRKMSEIIANLLLLAEVRKAELQVSPLDMASIVAEARQRLAYMIQEHQAQISLPAMWPQAVGYAPGIEEVWVNYLSNAIKYGGQPPRIELGAETQPDGMARFWIRDNGPGLLPEDQARLFTPFTRLDETRAKGHGLGLSIVKRIVEKLGGEVGVESQPGQGSIFSFTLPGAARSLNTAPGGSG